MGQLDGRVALITGAGRGIGASLARVMAREGAHLVVNDLGGAVDGAGADQAPAQQVVDEITAAGGAAVANFGNVADHGDAEGMVQQALDEYGRLDVLINVAGILRDRMVFNMTEAEWDAVVAVHLKGTYNTTRFAAIHWRQAREGHYRLINFTSVSGLHGSPGQPNYAAAKMGITGFTWSCANALHRYGVTANAIAPSAATRMLQDIPTDRQSGSMGDPTDDPRRSPDNIAPPVVYLSSTASDWLSGRVIGVRGYKIQLYANPSIEREMIGSRPWTVDEACSEMEGAFRSALEGGPVFPWAGLDPQIV
ncbi:MAG: SDR family NAD(P)-dependent oxidoreductase [Chloroflexi bacterium]|nr:SDR family NAD(P)-dependent oxidoreductase [Chloroflexota bacterium]